MADEEQLYGWERYGRFTRVAIVGLALNAIVFLVLGALFGDVRAVFVAAPSALIAMMFVAWAFAGPNIDDE